MASKGITNSVAKAIYEKRNGLGCKPWSYQTMSHQQSYLDDAQAAISTIRSALQGTTEPMVTAGDDLMHTKSPTTVWTAMLNASPLGEQSE